MIRIPDALVHFSSLGHAQDELLGYGDVRHPSCVRTSEMSEMCVRKPLLKYSLEITALIQST